MNEKQDIIRQMLEMQKKFIDYEHDNGVNPEEYFNPTDGHALEGYRQQYQALANRLIELAHEEKGSKR